MKVSIILPTYNRARFLPEAIASICGQTFEDWELVIVDDGSTDETRDVLEKLLPQVINPVRYVHQANAGAGPARNLGLEITTGEYVTFFDSDDLWRPEFLSKGVRALEQNPAIDWVSCDATLIDVTDRVLQDSQYYSGGKPRPFLGMRSRSIGNLRIIEDDRLLECAMQGGLVCLLQASVVRRAVFEDLRFWPEYRVIEDRFLVFRCIAQGVRFGYREDCDVVLRTHDGNSSLVGESLGLAPMDISKARRIYRDEVDAWLRLAREDGLTPRHRALANRNASAGCFWGLGYATYWMSGDHRQALEAFRRALSIWPWNPVRWKTYLLCMLRARLARAGRLGR